MGPIFFAVMYIALCVLYLAHMKNSPEVANKVLFKVLPLGILVGATTEYMKQRHTLSIKSTTYAPRIYTMVGGLFFHAMSAIYYEFPSLNKYGVVCYGMALMIEIYGYSSAIESFFDFTDNEKMAMTVLAIIFIAVYFYLVPKLNATNAVLVFVFSALDMMLVFVLTVHALRFPSSLHYMGALGGALRYLSGVVQVLSMYRIPIPHSFHVILTIYYTAQLVIGLSILLPITL